MRRLHRFLTIGITAAVVMLIIGFGICQAMSEGSNVAPPRFSTQANGSLWPDAILDPGAFSQLQEESPTPAAGQGGEMPTPPPNVAAMVDGQPIMIDAYEKQLRMAEWALKSQGYDLKSDEGKKMLATVRRQVLEDMINLAIIEQAAAAQGITVSQEAIDQTAAKTIKDGGGRAGFEKWLKDTGQTEEDYKNMIRAQLLVEAIGERVTGQLPDAAPQVHVRHILLDSKEKAEDVLKQAQGGADFAKLAKKFSSDNATKDQGGELGWLARQMMPPEIDAVIFESEVGIVPNVVEDAFGTFHVIEILEKDPQRKLTDEQRNALKASAFGKWLAEQRKQKEALIIRYIGFED